jgi:hypothetical protein
MIGYKRDHLDNWLTDLASADSQPVDLIVIGDSIGEFGWVEYLGTALYARFNAQASTNTNALGWKNMEGSLTGVTTSQGTVSTSTLAGYGATMTNAQYAEQTAVSCDGVIVVWKEGTGSLVVNDGATDIATIDTTTGDGSANITSIEFPSYTSRTVRITSTGNTTLEGVYFTGGNRTTGVRVWNASHTGYTTLKFYEDDFKVLTFITKLKEFTGREPHILLATGFNDPKTSRVNYLETMVREIRARTNGDITVWNNWGSASSNGNDQEKAQLVRDRASQLGLAIIDGYALVGDVSDDSDSYSLSDDGVHPNAYGVYAIANQAISVITGQPVEAALMDTINTPTVADGVDTNATTKGRTVLTTSFGYPIFVVYNDSTDANPQLLSGNSQIMILAGYAAGAGMILGAGGASAPDTNLYRSAANTLKTDDSLIVAGRLQQSQGADVSSANNLVLGADGNTFEITGTTQVNLISNLTWQNGSVVHLLFTSTPTVKHNQATSTTNITIQLAGAADFVATAGDTLTLVLCEIGGTQAWREVSRAVI